MICRICTNEKGLKTLRVLKAQYIHCPLCQCMFVDPYPGRELNLAFMGSETVERLEKEDEQRRVSSARVLAGVSPMCSRPY